MGMVVERVERNGPFSVIQSAVVATSARSPTTSRRCATKFTLRGAAQLSSIVNYLHSYSNVKFMRMCTHAKACSYKMTNVNF